MQSKHTYGLLISVYYGDEAEHFQLAVESCINTGFHFDEFVVVIDGKIKKEVRQYINELSQRNNIRVFQIKKNVGLAIALNHGLSIMKSDYIFRMDSDDISLKNRFFQQKQFIETNDNIDLLGGQIEEFDSKTNDVVGYRRVPSEMKDIKRMIRFKNPFNHPSVCFRREAVIGLEGYRDYRFFEDWDLWDRMIYHGYNCANLPDVILRFRTNKEQLLRRHGYQYLIFEFRFLKHRLIEKRMKINVFLLRFAISLFMRLVPIRMYNFLFKKIFR